VIDHLLPRELGDVETDALQADRLGHFLQLAAAVADAVVAFRGVIRQEELDDHLAGHADPLGVGLDDHPLGDGKDAGGDQAALAFHLGHADPASPGVWLISVQAQRVGILMPIFLAASRTVVPDSTVTFLSSIVKVTWAIVFLRSRLYSRAGVRVIRTSSGIDQGLPACRNDGQAQLHASALRVSHPEGPLKD
jgi:hypothetical protein